MCSRMSTDDEQLLPTMERILSIEQRFPFLPQLGCYSQTGVLLGSGTAMVILMCMFVLLLNNSVGVLPADCYRRYYVNATDLLPLQLPDHCIGENIRIPLRTRAITGSGLVIVLSLVYALGLCLYVLMAEVPFYRARIRVLEEMIRSRNC